MKTTLKRRLIGLLTVTLFTAAANAQTFRGDYATKLVFAGDQISPFNTLTLIAGANTAPLTLTLPTTTGTIGDVLTVDDQGRMLWTHPGSLSYGTPTAGNLLIGNGTGWSSVTLGGDATLASDGTLTLANSGVTAATYGDATHVAQVAVDSKGRVTSASNVAITGLAPGAINLASTNILVGGTGGTATAVSLGGDIASIDNTGSVALAATAVTAGSYGDGTHVATFTVDTKGRLTAAGTTLITGASPTGSAGGDLGGSFPNPTVLAVQTAAGSSIAAAINSNGANAIYGNNIMHDATLQVDLSHQLGINLANANTWTGTQTFGIVGYTIDSTVRLTLPTNDNVNVSAGSTTVVKLTATGAATVTSIANPLAGRMLTLINSDAAFPITIVSGAGTGTEANRIYSSVGNLIMLPGGTATFIYDATIQRWRYVEK